MFRAWIYLFDNQIGYVILLGKVLIRSYFLEGIHCLLYKQPRTIGKLVYSALLRSKSIKPLNPKANQTYIGERQMIIMPGRF